MVATVQPTLGPCFVTDKVAADLFFLIAVGRHGGKSAAIEPLQVSPGYVLLDAERCGAAPVLRNLSRCALTTSGTIGVLTLEKAYIMKGSPRKK